MHVHGVRLETCVLLTCTPSHCSFFVAVTSNKHLLLAVHHRLPSICRTTPQPLPLQRPARAPASALLRSSACLTYALRSGHQGAPASWQHSSGTRQTRTVQQQQQPLRVGVVGTGLGGIETDCVWKGQQGLDMLGWHTSARSLKLCKVGIAAGVGGSLGLAVCIDPYLGPPALNQGNNQLMHPSFHLHHPPLPPTPTPHPHPQTHTHTHTQVGAHGWRPGPAGCPRHHPRLL
jgi:hypothetical protein